MSGTTVMLGVTGILVGTVFLTSIFVQTVMGYSAIRAGVAFVPFALAITVGTVVARHAMAHGTPRAIAAIGLVIVAGGAVLLAQASAGSSFATGVLPGLAIIGLGVGMVFAPVSVTAMAGIPPQHAGMASGFLMTGHEVGAALGVAVLSAVASSRRQPGQRRRRRRRLRPRVPRRSRHRRRARRLRVPADARRPGRRRRRNAHAPLSQIPPTRSAKSSPRPRRSGPGAATVRSLRRHHQIRPLHRLGARSGPGWRRAQRRCWGAIRD